MYGKRSRRLVHSTNWMSSSCAKNKDKRELSMSKCLFLGCKGEKGYRMLYPNTKHVVTNWYVTSYEETTLKIQPPSDDGNEYSRWAPSIDESSYHFPKEQMMFLMTA